MSLEEISMNDDPLTTRGDITCRDSVHLVSLMRDGELAGSDEERLNQHIKSCKSCQVAKQQFELMHQALDILLARH